MLTNTATAPAPDTAPDTAPAPDNALTAPADQMLAVLHALTLHASKDAARPVLCNIRIANENGAVVMVTATGYTLAKWAAQSDTDSGWNYSGDPQIIDAHALVKAAKTICKTKRWSLATLKFNEADKRWNLSNSHLNEQITGAYPDNIPADFPKYDNVIPRPAEYGQHKIDGKPAAYDPNLLANICNSAAYITDSAMQCRIMSNTGASVFTASGCNGELTLVIMPMNIS